MALEFICSDKIEPWKKTRTKIPEGVNCYRCKSGVIRFFRSNPGNRFSRIPEEAREIEFYMEKNAFNIEYGEPIFYDREGNVLKIGDK